MLLLLIFPINIAQSLKKTQFDKKTAYKDFRFLASKTQKLSKKDFHSNFGIQLAKF
jgi:hypothetical protein